MTKKKRLFRLEGGLMVPQPEAVKTHSIPIRSSIPRKTVTIRKSEYDEWEKIKGEHTWTTILKTVREQYIFFRKVMENLTIRVQAQSEPVGQGITRIKRPVSSLPIQNNTPKSQMLKELKKLTAGKMSIKEFRESALKPMTEEELTKLQKSEEELVEAWEKQKIRLEDLKPPS